MTDTLGKELHDVWQYLAEFFSEWEIFQAKLLRKSKQIFYVQNFPPSPPHGKSCCLWDYVEKYGTAGQATDDTRAHALFMLLNL
jgi:hypothetical protein